MKVAIEASRHDTVGIDLVAMCVNDLVVQGAEPLFFLDYLATGRLDVAAATEVVTGIAEGCRQAGCALIGGETAEMPGFYGADDYDLAGFAVGAVERDAVITGETIATGDVVLGLAADGIHSNGFSLVRRIVAETGLAYTEPAPFDESETLAAALLRPTRIYVKSCLAAARTGAVKGLAHITGGGLVDNIPRILPPEMAAEIDGDTWQRPAVFSWLAISGGVEPAEMARTFNCGIGMIVVVDQDQVDAVTAALSDAGESVSRIGRIVPRGDGPAVTLDNWKDPWRA